MTQSFFFFFKKKKMESTFIDFTLRVLPCIDKTDSKTKMALREKLLSVEERVGILNLANRRTSSANSNQDNGTNTSYNEKEQEQQRRQENLASSLVDTLIISKITQSLQSVKQAAMSRASLKQDNVQTDDYTQQQHNPYHSHQIPSTDIHLDARTPLYQHPYPVNVVEKFKQFGQVLIQASVTLAILIKQSPIPALLSFCFTYFMQLLLWVDAYYGVRQRAQDLSVTGIKLLLQADEQYKLHELLSEFLFMMVAATLKAVVAYKETPRYGSFNMPSTSNEQQFQTLSEPKLKEINNNTDDSNNHLPSTPCASSSSYATLSSWVWSPRR
ncbi:uncharacterized protein BX664DRAFT_113321 [Halteromyces radiatus]|uniref:uncharacterized protein n=1 Tax=Halteromyces radiatus TaxID=101107 RepID=UPI002220C8B9|nr:uncharacterized protein BX664DRAFT_113321 [Halteromyces radiatus]KAI8093731.1 hypothetical protein BX664DRAFT_113321 [Halteromyces radiatus]